LQETLRNLAPLEPIKRDPVSNLQRGRRGHRHPELRKHVEAVDVGLGQSSSHWCDVSRRKGV